MLGKLSILLLGEIVVREVVAGEVAVGELVIQNDCSNSD